MIPKPQAALIDAVADAADAWTDEAFPPREEAVEATLEAPNRFTEPSLKYALNHQMGRLTREALRAWLDGHWAPRESADGEEATAPVATVGVLASGEVPLDALRDAVAVWGTGHRLLVRLADASPHLVPAFTDAVRERHSTLPVEFVDEADLYDRADALIAQPSADAIEAVRAECDAHDLPPSRRHVRPPVYSVGVIDGNESAAEREDLAADMLLHEGKGRPRLALLWAPRDLTPDPYLEAMAQFRGAVPAHPDTPGALQMQQAFLEAQDVSHAYATGLQFLMSRAEPEVQPPGHIRWTEYDALGDAVDWLRAHTGETYAVVAREGLHDRLHDALPDAAPILPPGDAHGAPLDDAEGRATVHFLADLHPTP